MGVFSQIKSIIRILNSADRPWQLTLPLLLGMILGLLPLLHPLHVAILVLALFLNCNFGLLLLSFSFFLGLSPLLDDFLHQCGQTVLTVEGLGGIWASLYHYYWFRMLGLNNTVVMGTLVVGVGASLPSFFILNKVFDRLQSLLDYLARIPLLGLLLARESKKESEGEPQEEGEEEVAKSREKAGLFHLGRLALAFVLILALAGFSYFLLDPLVKKGAEEGGSYLVGSEVSVGSLSTRLPSHIEVKNIQIAHPKNKMKNTLEAEKFTFSLNLWRSLEGKIWIDKAALTGIRFNTRREKGAEKVEGLDWEGVGTAFIPAGNPFEKIGDLSFESVKNILAREDLRSFSFLEEEKDKLTAMSKKWEKIFKAWEEKMKKRERQIRQLRDRSKNIKGPQDVQRIVRDSNQLVRDIDGDLKELKELEKELKRDVDKVKKIEEEVKSLAERDWKKLREKYDLQSKEGRIKLVKSLLGEEIDRHTEKVLYIYRQLMVLTGSVIPDLPDRRKGKDISLVKKPLYPDFVLKKGELSAYIYDREVRGEIVDFSSQPHLYGRPGVIRMDSGKGEKFERIGLEIRRTSKEMEIKDSFQFSARGIQPGSIKGFGKLKLKDPTLHLTGVVNVLNGKTLEGGIDLEVEKPNFSFSSAPKGELQREVGESLKGVTSFVVRIDLEGTLTNWETKISSDLDKRLTGVLQDKIRQKSQKFISSLENGFQKELKVKRAPLNSTEKDLAKNQNQLNRHERNLRQFQENLKNKYTKDALNKFLPGGLNDLFK